MPFHSSQMSKTSVYPSHDMDKVTRHRTRFTVPTSCRSQSDHGAVTVPARYHSPSQNGSVTVPSWHRHRPKMAKSPSQHGTIHRLTTAPLTVPSWLSHRPTTAPSPSHHGAGELGPAQRHQAVAGTVVDMDGDVLPSPQLQHAVHRGREETRRRLHTGEVL